MLYKTVSLIILILFWHTIFAKNANKLITELQSTEKEKLFHGNTQASHRDKNSNVWIKTHDKDAIIYTPSTIPPPEIYILAENNGFI